METGQNTQFIQYKELVGSFEKSTGLIIGNTLDKHYGIFLDVFVNKNFDVGDYNVGDDNNDNGNKTIQGAKLDILGIYHYWIEKNHEQAFDYWTKAFEKSNTDVLYYLGFYHATNEKNYLRANEYFSMSAETGDPRSMFELGLYYSNVIFDIEQGMQYYKMAVEKDHGYAMYVLGVHYHKLEENYEQAVKYYLMAVNAGVVNAMFELGNYYCIDEKNYEQAIKYYSMAIDKGDVTSMYNLAIYFDDIENSYEQAIQYYLLAIENGYDHGLTLFRLSLCYECAEQFEYADKYHQLAIEKGYDPAIFDLGRHYCSIRNFEQAVKYLLMTLDVNEHNSGAMFLLGYCYENIEGDNCEKALDYYSRASQNGHDYSTHIMGFKCANNENYEQAVEYYLKAVDAGVVISMCELGNYYYNVEKDYKQAFKYYIMAFDAVNADPDVDTDNLKIQCSSTPQDFEQARACWLSTITNGYFQLLGIFVELSEINETNIIHLYEDLMVICTCILASDNPIEYLHILNQSPKISFVTWKVLDKLIHESNIVLDENVVEFKKSLEINDVELFKKRWEQAQVSGDMDICPICLTPDMLIVKIDCGHGVCYDCWEPSIKCFYRCENISDT